MDIKAFLTKEAGGIPVWVWALVVVAGVGTGFFFVRKKGSSTPAASMSQAEQTVAASPSMDDLPESHQAFPETSVNNSNVPVIPAGFSPVMDSSGNLIGYQAPVVSSASTNTTRNVTTIAAASLESSPRNVNGKTLASVPSGATVQVLQGAPIPDPQKGSNKLYYPVIYNGQSGYIGSNALASTGNGGGGSTRTRQVRGLLA